MLNLVLISLITICFVLHCFFLLTFFFLISSLNICLVKNLTYLFLMFAFNRVIMTLVIDLID